MPIRFQCKCGRKYQVSRSLAGKTVQCRKCSQPVKIPTPAAAIEIEDEILDLANVDQEEASFAELEAGQSFQDPLNSPAADPFQATTQRSHSGTGLTRETLKHIVATNEGKLRPNFFKVLRLFPEKIAIPLGLTLIFSGAVLLHWLFVLPLILALAWLFFSLKAISVHFKTGCVNPGKILSLDPPLVAVYTDLSLGENSCHVIRLMRQPLKSLAMHEAKLGPISTVAMYFGLHLRLAENWFDVRPVITNFATNNVSEIQRIFASIPREEWDWLEAGLKQLPPNPEVRTYRVFRPEFRPHMTVGSTAELSGWIGRFLKDDECKVKLRKNEIDGEKLASFQAVLDKPIPVDQILAFSFEIGKGFIITPAGIILYHPKQGLTQVAWKQIKGTYFNLEFFEFVLIDGKRIVVSGDTFARVATRVQLSKLVNQVVGLGPED